MAYVAITGKLEYEVVRVINTMMKVETNGEKKPEAVIFTGHEEWLAPILWGVLHGTPLQWHDELTVNRTRVVMFSIHERREYGQCGDMLARATFDVESIPRHMYVDEAGSTCWTPEIIVRPDMHPAFAERVEYHANCAEITARWAKVEADIVKFFKSCKSLNEALKLWPALSRYVPQEFLDKAAERAEKPKKDTSAACIAMKVRAIKVAKVPSPR